MILPLLLLCSCSGFSEVKKISPPQKFTAEFSVGEFSGNIEFENLGETIIDVSLPESVSSMRFVIKADTCFLKYSGMEFECDKSLLNGSIPDTIVKVVSDLLLNNEIIEAKEEKSDIVRKGSWYKVYQNRESGLIKQIEASDYNIKFTYR
ncbi:MAG: hypothetical protein IJM97_07790 [Clostridia bacterium]|nr:hypothetical protein [Clostridia bacterium]